MGRHRLWYLLSAIVLIAGLAVGFLIPATVEACKPPPGGKCISEFPDSGWTELVWAGSFIAGTLLLAAGSRRRKRDRDAAGHLDLEASPLG